jgi:hypothetical protein
MVALWIYYSPTNDDLIGTAPVRQAATMRAWICTPLHALYILYTHVRYTNRNRTCRVGVVESQMPRGERRLKWQ